MDEPDADPRSSRATYERFRLVNAVVSGERAVYRRWVRPRLSPVWGTRLLDVGTGGADLPRALLRWAHADGLRLEVTAIDPDARAIAWAAAQPSDPRARAAARSSTARPRRGRRALRVVTLEPRAAPPRRARDGRAARRLRAAGRARRHRGARRHRAQPLGLRGVLARHAAVRAATCSPARTSAATASRRSVAATPRPSSPRCCRPGGGCGAAFPSRLEVVWGRRMPESRGASHDDGPSTTWSSSAAAPSGMLLGCLLALRGRRRRRARAADVSGRGGRARSASTRRA